MGRVSEEELAELQNPENWEDEEDAIRPAGKSPRAVVSVVFSREDFERISEAARRKEMKITEFIRESARDRV